MISILCPTRKRPDQLRRMVDSVQQTITNPMGVEIVLYVDDDDIQTLNALDTDAGLILCGYVRGPRLREMTKYWNECFKKCSGDIVMQGNDDVIFRTPGWDSMVEKAFAACPDKILMVHGSDEGQHLSSFGPHPFVHRKWIETLGWFIPPYFSSDWGDAWVNELADALGRRQYLPFIVEHLHFLFKKAVIDETTRERLERHKKDNPDKIYREKLPERIAQIAKLKALMDPKWKPPANPVTPRKPGAVAKVGAIVDPQALKCRYCSSPAVVVRGPLNVCNQCGRYWKIA